NGVTILVFDRLSADFGAGCGNACQGDTEKKHRLHFGGHFESLGGCGGLVSPDLAVSPLASGACLAALRMSSAGTMTVVALSRRLRSPVELTARMTKRPTM